VLISACFLRQPLNSNLSLQNMTHRTASIEVTIATEATEELVSAFGRLIPQLSSSAVVLDRDALAEVIAAPCNTVLVARDRDHGGQVVGTLTLVIFRIPTAVRAWIEDVVVDSNTRGRGVGEALTQQALRLASERGAQTVDLTSRSSREAARKLYEKVGFKLRDSNVYRYVASDATKHAHVCVSARQPKPQQ
jgi:ribosomal protein S18 acetylase RimI-like enzyme